MSSERLRISWNELFIKMAHLVSQRSTCVRMQVGAVLVKNGRIVSMGYNGVAHSQRHCHEYFKNYPKEFFSTDEFFSAHGKFSTNNEIHAEMNALLYAAKHGIKTENSEIYVTNSPCIECAKALYTSGIKKVYYNIKYDRSTQGIEFLVENSIPCIEVKIDEIFTNQ